MCVYALATASQASIDEFLTLMLAMVSGASILSIIFVLFFPIMVFILKITLPIICAVHAKKKGYSAIGFYLYGLLSFVIAMGVIILATPKPQKKVINDELLEEEQIAEIKSYYENGAISYTQMNQKIDEIKMRKYNK